MFARALLFALCLVTGLVTPLTLLAHSGRWAHGGDVLCADGAVDSVWGPRTTTAFGQNNCVEAPSPRPLRTGATVRRSFRAPQAACRNSTIHRPTYPPRRACRRALLRSATDDPAA
jgi:hypothetical protein